MPDNNDQLAQLGEQVVATITQAYLPQHGSTLALALHPGQAVADGLAQAGVTNELRLSEWLASQYDNPMTLKLADGTPVVSTSLGGVTAKAAYLTMARWAQPGVAADSAAFPRIAQLLSDIRRDLGDNPEALPFGCEPTDFVLPDCAAWQVFDTTISAHASEETVTPAPAGPPSDSSASGSSGAGGSTGPDGFDPELWRIRPLAVTTIADLPRRRRVCEEEQQLADQMSRLSDEAGLERLRDVRRAAQVESPVTVATRAVDESMVSAVRSAMVEEATQPSVSDAVSDVSEISPNLLSASVANFVTARPLRAEWRARSAVALGNALTVEESPQLYLPQPAEPAEPAEPVTVRLDASLVQDLVHVHVEDLVDQPAVSTATTSDSSLHVHFEYLLVSITRLLAGRPWWHPEFLAEPNWFVPGMKRGALIPESTDPGYGHCLPQALLLVRNVRLTGVWSDEAKATMTEPVHYFGPFLMSPPDAGQTTTTDTQHVQQTTVLGLGVQVIGELCSPLPVLPAMDDPSLASH